MDKLKFYKPTLKVDQNHPEYWKSFRSPSEKNKTGNFVN